MTIKTITSKELIKNKDPSFIILDIREEEAYQDWHIPHAQNIALYNDIWAENLDKVRQKLAILPKNKKIITICNAGVTSQKASAVLESLGYETLVLEGGMRGWNTLHTVTTIVQNEELILKQIIRPGKGCISYLLGSCATKECMIIDPSNFTDEYSTIAAQLCFNITGVIDTHIHADHISGATMLAANTSVKYFVSSKDFRGQIPFIDLSKTQEITIGKNTIKILETPGHTEGSVCLLLNNQFLFTGDTLFLDGVGRPDLGREQTQIKNGAKQLYASLQTIKNLTQNVLILPAHCSFITETVHYEGLKKVLEHIPLLQYTDQEEFVAELLQHLPKTPPNYAEIKHINTNAVPTPQQKREQLEFGPNRCASS